MVLWHADGIVSAREVGAWVDAGAALAGQLAGAVLVDLALDAVGHGAADGVGLSGGAPRAGALVAAAFVDTPGVGAARVVPALIHVFASNQWVASVARLAEALGWVGRRAFGVEAAAKRHKNCCKITFSKPAQNFVKLQLTVNSFQFAKRMKFHVPYLN